MHRCICFDHGARPPCRNMKRRAANVKVTKRAAPQSNNANTATGGNNASGAGGQEDGSGQYKELMGVVSLVQLERHYGFIEVCEIYHNTYLLYWPTLRSDQLLFQHVGVPYHAYVSSQTSLLG